MKRILIIILYVSFHFTLLSSIRSAVFSFQVNGGFLNETIHSDRISITKIDKRMIWFDYHDDTFRKKLSYKISFGFYFLLGMIGLIIQNTSKEFIYMLIMVHILGILVSSILFKLSGITDYKSLIVIDLITRYLIPLFSLGLMPLSYLQKKKSTDES